MSGLLIPSLALALLAQDLRRTPAVAVAESAGPTVVNISADVVEKNPFSGANRFDPFWQQFFEGQNQPQRTSQSLGSGVIIDASGLVLTNEHVVSRASRITVTLKDRRKLEADVVAADPAFDVAVLKITSTKDLPVARLGTSEDLMPGEPAIAIGNPFGLSNSVTTGVVSALHRSVQAGNRVYEDFIQTDAAINPGNSGGALFNIEGRLIGINTAIYQSANGIGFAIPIDKAMAVVDEVLKYGEVRPVFLGLSVERFGRSGARVRRVYPGTPAAELGLEVGDLIVDIGGAVVEDGRGYLNVERSLVPGQKVKLRVRRASASLDFELIARELSMTQAVRIGQEALGFSVSAQKRGPLIVTRVSKGSHAAEVGLIPGDAILSLAGRPIRSLEDFERMCARLRGADSVSLIVGRRGRSYYVTLRLG
jgi:serine protease Do